MRGGLLASALTAHFVRAVSQLDNRFLAGITQTRGFDRSPKRKRLSRDFRTNRIQNRCRIMPLR